MTGGSLTPSVAAPGQRFPARRLASSRGPLWVPGKWEVPQGPHDGAGRLRALGWGWEEDVFRGQAPGGLDCGDGVHALAPGW